MIFSPCAMSNFFTKAVAARQNPLQQVERSYTIPGDPRARKLLALLVLEEAYETVKALGFAPSPNEAELVPHKEQLDLPSIIDGACDTIYVATGVLCACGVPDRPHVEAVCAANNAKFPNEVAITDQQTGKYLKPKGWAPPDHQKVMGDVGPGLIDCCKIAADLIRGK